MTGAGDPPRSDRSGEAFVGWIENADAESLGHTVSRQEHLPEEPADIVRRDREGEHGVRQAWRRIYTWGIYALGAAIVVVIAALAAAVLVTGTVYIHAKLTTPGGAETLVFAGLKFFGIAAVTLIGQQALRRASR